MAGLKDFPNNGALHGLKILDSGSNIAGPFAGGLLAGAGATVIHFEAPKKPDNQRRMVRISPETTAISSPW